jgi:hypothetical protein
LFTLGLHSIATFKVIDCIFEKNYLTEELYDNLRPNFISCLIILYVLAVVTTPSLQKHQPTIIDNKDSTVKIGYKPSETGPHTLEVNYAGVPLQGSPYKFSVQPVTAGKVSVFGSGLSSGLAGQPSSFTVVTKDAGPGRCLMDTKHN